MKLNELKNAKDMITTWLTNYPELRDNDAKLIANIWAKTIGKERFETMSARELLQMYVDGDLPQVETIRRTRAKVQEQDASLRGKSYKGRHEQGSEITKGIHEI